MDADSSNTSPSGRLVPVTAGYRAFVPNLLPPPIVFDGQLDVLTSEADQALGGIRSVGRFIPNPSLLAVPYLNMEAVLSSAIEGTHTTLSELYRSGTDQEGHPDAHTQEVINYVKAMNLGVHRIRDEGMPVSLRLVRELHSALVTGVRGANSAPGQWRTLQVHVGPGGRLEDATYVPPPANEVPRLLDDWEKFLHGDHQISPVVKCAIMHAQFEMMHPLFDGNGRVGRLLVSLFLIEKAALSEPLLYVSGYLERHRDEYYQRLLNISRTGDWMGWIYFFLRAVAAQAQRACDTAARIFQLRDEVHAALHDVRAASKAIALADRLLERPVITIGRAAEELGVTFPTAAKYIGQLGQIGFVEETTGRSVGQEFMVTKLLAIVEQGASPGEDEKPGRPELSLT